MLYRELVQFDPIDDIIQLRDADEKSSAKNHVETYVISDRMADQLINVVIPQLQFKKPLNNKGVLIVGNYGTGKSHLMSVLSSIAEYPDLLNSVRREDVAETAESISGKFKVWRVEIGGVKRSLRDILLSELEEALDEWGTPYSFPASEELTNHKDVIIEAVAGFQEKHPDHGILLVVDELLDYLRGRKGQELILDLGFLRELGEVSKLAPFRFMAGLQESLFDNPRFSFVAKQLHRVKDRFDQLRIAREDIAYVVSERLLKKEDEQLARIREHLRPFTPLYTQMAERLDEFVSLFPIHPAYIDTFERVFVAEKREVLKTFSKAVQSLLDESVPDDQPGLVSYDHYWDILRNNPSMRGLEGVSEVIEKSNILEGRIKNAYTRKHLLPLAIRIIHGLSVHRLTTPDIRTTLGATPEELRDQLTLYTSLPDESAEMLLDQVEVALKEIMSTVNGQYITHNQENKQYYLDVDKDIDFEALIQKRGDSMSEDELDRYFFDALRLVLNLSDTTYTTAGKIWFYEMPWMDHKVTRPGYLFFGAPDERTTAQPPRDFYVYVLPPFSPRSPKDYHDGQFADEVIFKLTGLGQEFESIVKTYAGARALANESSTHRGVYADKAGETLRRRLNPWVRENFSEYLEVRHQGVDYPIREVLAKTRSTASRKLEDLLRIASAYFLEQTFDERYPEYPVFERVREPISEDARPVSAMEAIRYIAGQGRGRTTLATGILEGLGLIDAEGVIRPRDSLYAQYYLNLLENKPEGQVVNQGEVIDQVAGGDQPIYKGFKFKLEPEWIVVILLALIYNGDIVLRLGNQSLDAGNIENAATMAIETLMEFRFYGQPRTLPLNKWMMIFEGLGLTPGLIRDENERRKAVEKFQGTVHAELEKTATLLSKLQSGLKLWNSPVFTDNLDYTIDEHGSVKTKDIPPVTFSTTELLPELRGYKEFLEKLKRFNTIGNLRNLRLTITEIEDALTYRKTVTRGEKLFNLINDLQPISAYLAEAQANMPDEHPWSEKASNIRQRLLENLRHLGKGESAPASRSLQRELESLKDDYIQAYAELHRKLVLNSQNDDYRLQLYEDPRLKALKLLEKVDLLQQTAVELEVWEKQITGFKPCREFHERAIQDSPTCPFCSFRPSQRSTDKSSEVLLIELDDRLGDIMFRWQQALRDALNSESAQASIEAMTPSERQPLDAFLEQPDSNPDIPNGFVVSANRALRGIEAVIISVDNLIDALKVGGLPCTKKELQTRFDIFINKALRGKDERNTRLTLDQ
ncbi:MAG: hypothetical protein B5M51_03365 [Anaerolinea sp. 4484_236]|nr:MAG: hypothetical protein B5M51_03365 [Anaerolinea sp. 4484_236]